MSAEVAQQPTVDALGDESMVEEVVAALKSMGNSKSVGLLKLALHHRSTDTRVWREGKVPQRWGRSSMYSTEKTRLSVGTTVVYLSCEEAR